MLTKNATLHNANFIVLDSSPAPSKSFIPGSIESPAHVDIGFGDDQKSFNGLFRFEVERDRRLEKGDRYTTISYSSVTCNPTTNMPPFPGFVGYFHRWYATQLFRDGLREVLVE